MDCAVGVCRFLPMPRLSSWRECWKKQTLSLVVLALVAPLARSIRFCLAHDDWIKDWTIPFGLAKLWSMSYLGPMRVDPIDRLKPSSPKMCLGA